MPGKVVFTVGAVLRGDDGAGPLLAKMMIDDPIEGWDVIDGEQLPEDFIAVVVRTKPDFLLLVDAADMALNPGQIRFLRKEDVATDYLMTTHSLPLTFLLGQIEEACGEVVFLGIQPAQTDFFAPLTPEVLAAVEEVYDAVKHGDLDRFSYLEADA